MDTKFPVTRKKSISELKRENKMRLRVYGRGRVENMSIDQRRWYDITCHLEAFFSSMTDAEFNRFMKRKADFEKAKQAQGELF